MITQQTQIKINLPLALKEFLESKANRFGMPLAGYVKHLILKDVEEMDYPTFQASKQTERAYKQALKDQKAGKLVRVDDVEKFFKEL
jgi:predicted DNA-binding protein